MSSRLVRLAIAVNNSLHNRFYKPYLFWNPENMILKRVDRKLTLIPWYTDQFMAVFLYGFVANSYCAIRELIFKRATSSNVNLLQVTFFLSASVTAYTMFITTRAMMQQSNEVVLGMNALRKYQSKLTQRYPMQAFEVAMEHESRAKKNIQHLLGLWLLTSIILSATTILFAFPAVYFNLDPLYFIFQDIYAYIQPQSPLLLNTFQVSGLQLGIRFSLSFWFLFCTSRFYCFLYIFGLLKLQGYKLSLSFLAKLHLAANLFSELRKMRILHSCLYSFCNVLYAMIMLYGQLTILMIWTTAFGWNHLPQSS